MAFPALTISPFDEHLALEAAFVRAQTGLKLPDAAVVATARLSQAAFLIGNDRQWLNKPLGVEYFCIDGIVAMG